jgi:predicted RNA-binding protein YlxR (DUF448 family)
MTSIQVHLHHPLTDQHRILNLDRNSSQLYQQLQLAIHKQLSIDNPIIKFDDFEGDLCRVCSAAELLEALDIYGRRNQSLTLIVEGEIKPDRSNAEEIGDLDHYISDEDDSNYQLARNHLPSQHSNNTTQQQLQKQLQLIQREESKAAEPENQAAQEAEKSKETNPLSQNSAVAQQVMGEIVSPVENEPSAAQLDSHEINSVGDKKIDDSDAARESKPSSEHPASLAPLLQSFFADPLVQAALESPALNRSILAGASLREVVEGIVAQSPQLADHAFVQTVRAEAAKSNNAQNEQKYSQENNNNDNVPNNSSGAANKGDIKQNKSRGCWFEAESKKFADKLQQLKVKEFFQSAFTGVKDFIDEVVASIEGRNARKSVDYAPVKPRAPQAPCNNNQFSELKPVECVYIHELEQVREMGLISDAVSEATARELLNSSKGNVDQTVGWLLEKINVSS